MDQFTIQEFEGFTASLQAMKTESPQVAAAILYAKTLIQSRPLDSGFVVGKEGWRYFTTESSPRYFVYYYVDEIRKSIVLMQIHALEESE